MKAGFRRCCASALTHPITLAAVAVLFVNDLVLKTLWSNPWTSGKLSDLAWVIFASPLLAFVLSFATRRNNSAQRVAFVTAYIGLPVLYAAFNTFEPLHDLIISGLLLASGGSFGSPLDPTDSVVIPIGLAIALWVWRRPTAPPQSMRVRLALLAAGVAVFATVATSPASQPSGEVGIINDEILFIDHMPQYTSEDGGLTWEEWGGSVASLGLEASASKERGRDSVRTSHGYFFAEGTNVIRETDDSRELVYSPLYLENKSDSRFQAYLDRREGCSYRCPSSTILNLIYHPPSGNVVASAGNQGVVLIGSDGTTRQIAIGPEFTPPDYSLSNKLHTVFGDSLIWWTAGALSVMSTITTLALAHRRSKKEGKGHSGTSKAATPFFKQGRFKGRLSGETLVVIAVFFAAVLFVVTSLVLGNEASLFFIAITVVLGTMLMSSAAGPAKRFVSRQTGGACLTCGVITSVLSFVILLTGTESTMDDPSSYQTIMSVLLILSFLLGTTSSVAFSPTLRQLPITVAALLGMMALFSLAFFIGIMQGFDLVAAKFYAVILILLASFTLWLYLRRSRLPAPSGDSSE